MSETVNLQSNQSPLQGGRAWHQALDAMRDGDCAEGIVK